MSRRQFLRRTLVGGALLTGFAVVGRHLTGYAVDPAVAARLRVLQRLGRTREVEQLASAMRERAPNDPGPWIALAEIRRAAGQREEALALLAAHSRASAVAVHRALHLRVAPRPRHGKRSARHSGGSGRAGRACPLARLGRGVGLTEEDIEAFGRMRERPNP